MLQRIHGGAFNKFLMLHCTTSKFLHPCSSFSFQLLLDNGTYRSRILRSCSDPPIHIELWELKMLVTCELINITIKSNKGNSNNIVKRYVIFLSFLPTVKRYVLIKNTVLKFSRKNYMHSYQFMIFSFIYLLSLQDTREF